jgi:hypothetical protein
VTVRAEQATAPALLIAMQPAATGVRAVEIAWETEAFPVVEDLVTRAHLEEAVGTAPAPAAHGALPVWVRRAGVADRVAEAHGAVVVDVVDKELPAGRRRL